MPRAEAPILLIKKDIYPPRKHPRNARVISAEELSTMSKNNLKRITIRPVWRIRYVTLIISWGTFLSGDLNHDQWSKISLDHGASKKPMNPLWLCNVSFCLCDREICEKTYRSISSLIAWGLLWNLHRVMVWKYFKPRYNSRGNNPEKHVKLCTGFFWLILNLNNIGNKPCGNLCVVRGWKKMSRQTLPLMLCGHCVVPSRCWLLQARL